MIKKFLTTSHRWLGFPVGILFIITFATGLITAIDELSVRVDQALLNNNNPFQHISISDNGAVLSKITTAKKRISRIIMPTEATPYYQLANRNENWLYQLSQPKVAIHLVNQGNVFFKTVLQLHRNFLLGKTGAFGVGGNQLVAWVGLIALMISLIGLWIWWPKRRLFSVRDTLPRGKKRKNLYGNHTSTGVICLIAILTLALTGAGITYRNYAKALLGVTPQANNAKMTGVSKTIDSNWSAWLHAAYSQMPAGSTLIQISYPRAPRKNVKIVTSNKLAQTKKSLNRAENKVNSDTTEQRINHNNKQSKNKSQSNSAKILTFKFNTPNNWFGLAQSHVRIDINNSQLISTTLFSQLPMGEKIYSLIKPLHTGHGLPVGYVIVQLIFSLLGTVMVCSGVIMFINKKRKKNLRHMFTFKLYSTLR